MKLDEIMPVFDKREHHSIEIAATPEEVYDAIWELDLSESRLASAMFRLRGLPPESRTLRGLIDLGFNLLVDDPPREMVLGIAAAVWTAKPELLAHDADSFREFDTPGYAKAGWNFLVEPLETGATRLSTETRIQCTDQRSRRRFAIYWLFVRLGSGWIRRIMLGLIKKRAEARAT